MSFHSIDLQLAIHKNDQAGLKQHQMMQKPSEDQVITGQETMKLAEKKLRQSTQVDKSGASGIQDDGQRGQNGRREEGNTDQAEDQETNAPRLKHPYKGRFIDLSL